MKLLNRDQLLASGETLRQWAKRFWVTITLVLVGLAVCVSNVAQHTPQFSPYDEWVYYDYLTKVPTQGFVHQGELIGEDALELMACFGDPYGARGEACTGPNGVYDDNELYPQQGKTSADPYTPAYFATTWVAAKAIQFVTGTDLQTAGRSTGALWLSAGLIVLTMFLREFRLRPILILGLGLGLIGLTTTYYAFTYISTDAPSLLVGATIALLGVRFAKTGRYMPWLILASVVGVWFKVTNIFAVGLVVVALLIHALFTRRIPEDQQSGPTPRRMAVVAGLMTAAALCAEGIWLIIWHTSSVGQGPDQGISSNLTVLGFVKAAFTFLLPRDGIGAGTSWLMLTNFPFFALVVAGVLGWFLQAHGQGLSRSWSIAVLISATVFAPALTLAMQLLLGTVAPITPRYSAPLAPMFLLAIGMMVRNSISVWMIFAYGAALSAIAIIGLGY